MRAKRIPVEEGSGNIFADLALPMEFLTALGQDVRITVKPTRKAQGEMSVVMG